MNNYPDWLYDDPDMTYFPPIDDKPEEIEEFSLLEEDIFSSGFMPIPEDWIYSSDDPNPLDLDWIKVENRKWIMKNHLWLG